MGVLTFPPLSFFFPFHRGFEGRSRMFMSVVAHPDDDLLFVNPDIADAIRSGRPVVTVFITAGQKTGQGATDGERARSRQRGIQDAYAHMAGIPYGGCQSEWDGDLLAIAGRQLERYTLRGTQVQLVWIALRDGQLTALYNGTPHLTVPTTGGLGAPQYGYNKADVVNLLSALIGLHGPERVRSMDPLPESRYTPVDHPDHTTAAWFVRDASPVTVIPYRGYSISSLPQNLSDAVAADKLAFFNTYAAYDPSADAGGWTERMHYRWPRGTTWTGRNADGRLQVFSVHAGALRTWWQLATGGWSAPKTLTGPGGPLAPTLAVAHHADGRMEVFARRLSDHRIVSVRQTSPNGAWPTVWADLGNHNAGASNAGQMGCPTVARNADGRLVVFVKNGGGGLSSRTQSAPGGAWGAWTDLGGTDVQDGIAAVVCPDGRLEVFAPTRAGLLHWYQVDPNGPFTAHPSIPALPPTSPPTVVVDALGQLVVAYRHGTDIAVSVQPGAGGAWPTPTVLPGPGGHGQVAALLHNGQVRLAARNAAGGVSTAAINAPGDWTDLGGAADCPAVAINAAGLLTLFAADAGVSVWTDGPGEEPAWIPLP